MTVIISRESADSADAVDLITELEEHLATLYPPDRMSEPMG